MPTSAPTPSLLLTKRLTAFLSSNLSPQIHTAVLTTPSGKLLAHASPHPVGTLRTQCTVAASIWALYAPFESRLTVISALPPHTVAPDLDVPAPSAVTIQLAAGVMVVRRLRCGLLFVCIGPAAEGGGVGGDQSQAQAQNQGRPMPAPQQSQQQQQQQQSQQAVGELHSGTPLGSPSEVESVASVGAATTASVATTNSAAASAVVATRRQAEELARWLDDKLGSLGVLEEGLGVETR